MTDHNENERDTGEIESIAQRLKDARKKKGLTLEEASAQLRLPYSTLELLEEGRVDELGPPVYVRGYIQNYARLLDEEVNLPRPEPRQADTEEVDAPVITLRPAVGRGRRLVDQYAKMASYLVATVVVVLPILWWGGTGLLDSIGIHGSDSGGGVSDDRSAAVSADPGEGSGGDSQTTATDMEGPVVASMTPRRSVSQEADTGPPPTESIRSQLDTETATRAPAGMGNGPDVEALETVDESGQALPQSDESTSSEPGQVPIALELSGDSWVEITDGQGVRLEYSLLRESSAHEYAGWPPLRFVIGNASAVKVRVDGQPFDTRPFRQGNLARFEVNADGLTTAEAAPATD